MIGNREYTEYPAWSAGVHTYPLMTSDFHDDLHWTQLESIYTQRKGLLTKNRPQSWFGRWRPAARARILIASTTKNFWYYTITSTCPSPTPDLKGLFNMNPKNAYQERWFKKALWKWRENRAYSLMRKRNYFDKQRDIHPYLWSTLSQPGFCWSDDDIFAVWQSHPHYFNMSQGTSLGAAALLLSTQQHKIKTAGPKDKPNFCWRERNGHGHFETTKHHQPMRSTNAS